MSHEPGDGPGAEALTDEQRRLDRLRRVVDVTCMLLRQPQLTRDEAVDAVAVARRQVLELFPGKEEVYELVLAPRFERILDERWPRYGEGGVKP